MKKVKKIGKLVLTSTLMLSALSACSGGNNAVEPSQSPTGTANNEGVVEQVKDLGIVKVVNMGAKPTLDMDKEYYPILDELTKPFGIKIRVDYVAWGEEKTTLQTRIAAGDIDMMAIGPWSNYSTLSRSNAFYDLNKVIDQAPKLIEKFGGKDELKKLEIDGKLNYIPQFSGKSNINANGVLYRADLGEKWGLAPITDLASLEAYLYRGKEELNRPMFQGNSDVASWLKGLFYTNPTDLNIGLDFVASDSKDPYKAVNIYEAPEYLDALKLAKKWYDEGITDPDILNNAVDVGVMMQDDVLPISLVNHFQSYKMNFMPQAMNKLNGGEADANAANPKGVKFDFFPYLTADAKLVAPNMGNTTGVALGVNISDEKAAALIKFIEAVHTDKEFFDKFQYGKEGVSYASFPSDTTVDFGTISGEERMYRKVSVGFTNNDMIRTEKIRYSDLEEKISSIQAKLDSLAVDNPINGFIFDPSKVENQIMAVNEVLTSLSATRAGITGKKSAEEALEEMNNKIKAAGAQAIIDELNVQLAAFKAQVNG
jgi:putative aldouronate transport system substrate-binding protein